jgi:predicted alpha/beta-fold hydrolase
MRGTDDADTDIRDGKRLLSGMSDCAAIESMREDPTHEPYAPPRWLRNAHLQTLYAACLAQCPRVGWKRERWSTPDGDFIDLDWLQPAQGTARAYPSSAAPLIVLFHGLEGGSGSHYARTLMHAIDSRGWHGVVIHFRGCSGEPNRLPRAYHSGDSAEIDWILQRMHRQRRGPLAAIAISLGGNALLKWLGETGRAAAELIVAACAVSAPVDLCAAGAALEQGFNRLYTWNFLRTLKRKGRQKSHRFPGILDRAALHRARTLRAFDDQVTAPLHGFVDAHDYWTRCSSKPWLRHIAVPTLVLNARDDPFLPGHALPGLADVSPAVTLEQPAHGGHGAFVTGPFPGKLDWMPTRTLAFIDSHLRGGQPALSGVA